MKLKIFALMTVIVPLISPGYGIDDGGTQLDYTTVKTIEKNDTYQRVEDKANIRAALSSCSCLTILALKSNNFSDRDIEGLFENLRLPSFQTLDLSGNMISVLDEHSRVSWIWGPDFFKIFPNLTRLDLRGNRIDYYGKTLFKQPQYKNPGIEVLLTKQRVNTVVVLPANDENGGKKHLRVALKQLGGGRKVFNSPSVWIPEGIRWTPYLVEKLFADISAFADFLPTVNGYGIDPAIAEGFVPELVNGASRSFPDCVDQLAGQLVVTTRKLGLTETVRSFFARVGGIVTPPATLQLSYGDLAQVSMAQVETLNTDKGERLVRGLLTGAPRLESLNLSDNNLNSAWVAGALAPGSATVKTLILSHNQIQGDGGHLQALKNVLKKFSKIQTLDLQGNPMTEAQMRELQALSW